MSTALRSSSRLCGVRFLRQCLVSLSALLTLVLEGEQFANAYFDTETKIKMFVPLNPTKLKGLHFSLALKLLLTSVFKLF